MEDSAASPSEAAVLYAIAAPVRVEKRPPSPASLVSRPSARWASSC